MNKLFPLALFSLFTLSTVTFAQEQNRIIIDRAVDPSKTIPIALNGYSGEVASVLNFDLSVVGFEIVPPESAVYLLAGKNEGRVEGQLIDRVSRKVLLGKAYQGGTLRSQAHALADDIVKTLLNLPGIAQTKIAFKGKSGRNTEIYLADYDGANAKAVTRDGALVAAPTWTPDGRMLFYTSYMKGFPDVYSHDLYTGTRRAVAAYPGLNTSPAVSPDGRKLALILSKGGSPDLYVCDLDGSNLKQLTKTKDDESSPCWSPDGKRICFVSRMSGRTALYTIPAEGGEPRKISTIGAGTVTEPSWSPDGKWIAFTVLRRDFQVAVVPVTGGVAKDLVAGEDPYWSPNSRTLIFSRMVNGRRILSLLDVPTERVKDIPMNLGSCSQPSWAKK